MKKFFAVLLSAMMVFSLTACVSEPGTGTGTPAVGGDPTEITIYFFGAAVTEDDAVVEAANARLQELGLNITVNPIWGDWDAGDRIINVLDTGDSSVDVVFTSSWAAFYVPNAMKGSFARLDDPENNLLEQYGQDMVAAVPEFLWDGFKIDIGQGPGIYAVPGYKDFAQLNTWDVNNTRLTELGFNIDDFEWTPETLFDPQFEEAMAAAKEKYGDTFYPFAPESTATARSLSYSDADISGLGVMHFPFDPEDPSQPRDIEVGVNLENETYVKVLTKLNEFFKKGYIDPRLGIDGESVATATGLWETGEYLFATRTYTYGFDATASAQRGIDARFMPMYKPFMSTVPVQGSGYGVSVYSEHKPEAVQFLNAWYTDQELANILTYGVPGDDFTMNDDGTVTLAEDTRASFAPWQPGMGNYFIQSPQDNQGVDFFEGFKAFNDAGIGTNFLGFNFDQTNVENEVAALQNVMTEFQANVTTGVGDAETQIAAYTEKLYANGMQKVLDEMNAQLAEFYAGRTE